MKTLAVGTDIVKISRIEKNCQNENFVKRVYSEEEFALFSSMKNPYPSMAGNWAAKEAFSKCLGTGVRNFSLREVSCLRDELGCPYLKLTGKAKEVADKSGYVFAVSISHEKEYAVATVVGINFGR